jgi:hypothetical protein
LEQSAAVQLMGRVGTQQGFAPANINAYYLQVSDSGAWSILKNAAGGSFSTIRSGNVAALGTNSWHTLSLGFSGSTITAMIDGSTVGTATDSSYSSGQVGIGVNGWQNVQFDNFSVTSSSTTTSGTYYNIVNVNSNMVLDVPNVSNQQGLQLEQWTSNGGANQQWLFTSVGDGYYTITSRSSNQLVSVSGASTADSAAVVQNPANNGAEQQWSLTPIPRLDVSQ